MTIRIIIKISTKKYSYNTRPQIRQIQFSLLQHNIFGIYFAASCLYKFVVLLLYTWNNFFLIYFCSRKKNCKCLFICFVWLLCICIVITCGLQFWLTLACCMNTWFSWFVWYFFCLWSILTLIKFFFVNMWFCSQFFK